MENVSKALIIAGAILLSILIIAIGIYIYQSASGTINNSLASMNTQEIEAFNAQFSIYQSDNKSGTEIRTLITKLIANASTYKDEVGKVPTVNVRNLTNSSGHTIALENAEYDNASEEELSEYVNSLSEIANSLVSKHKYTIEFTYGSTGIINTIDISDNTFSNDEYYDPNTNYADQNVVNDWNNDDFDSEEDFSF